MRQTAKSEKNLKEIKKSFKKVLTNRSLCGIISFVQYGTPKRWCGSMAEQLICNQQVVGSTPITSSKQACYTRRASYGGFPERPKGADCKSVVTDFGGPNPPSPTRKKHTFVYQDNVCFFQRNLPLRASEIASL